MPLMRWQQGRRSSNVDDRRAQGGGGGGRGGRGIKLGGGGVLVVIVIAVGMALMGKDPSALLEAVAGGGTSGSTPSNSAPAQPNPEQDQLADFATVVLADTEDVWGQLFAARGERYRVPQLVLFRGSVDSACGRNTAAVGPFYCPGDLKVYIDLSFFDDLDRRFGAPGDFAQAYVIAHEVGHHVQKLMGISDRIRAQRREVSEQEGNALSVRQELQADCFAGVWAHHANRERQLLEPGDIDEGLRAAAAIGDDTLQRRSGGAVSPESWTHGSSAQRVRWFRQGFSTGDASQCDTFAAGQL